MTDEHDNLSIIEDMAVTFYNASYRGGPPIVVWSALTLDDRMRYIKAMEAAVRSIPDRVDLKRGLISAACRLDETRDFILGEHDAAKDSALYRR